ncbi:pentapeptide repeat-containing protein [Clostridium saudiense]|nr:pentapeptide repeat-containing protein [Clostridium saudiense]
MAKLVKVQKPKFIDDLEEIEDIYDEVIYVEKIQNKIIEDREIVEKNDIGITIDSCILKNVVFKECDFARIDLLDSRFENCDLSNVSFSGGGLHRVEFVNCKLIGANFSESSIKDVTFQNIMGGYATFSFSKLKNINFIESNLKEAVFQEVKLDKVVFEECDLTNGYFNKTFLGKQDLTSCDIEGIDIEIENIYGTTVTAMQGLELTRLMGLIIK